MKNKCILCGEVAETTKIEQKSEYSVKCRTCGEYIYDHFFENSYLNMPKEERAMISAFTREFSELGMEPPKLDNPDYLEVNIKKYKNKTIEEKLNNLILYLKKKSSYLGDNIDWDEKKDYPITYSPNPQEFSKIRDLAKSRNLIYWRSADSGLELTGDGWEKAEIVEKEFVLGIKEKRDQFIIKLNELSRGNVDEFIESIKLGEEIGIDRETTFNFVRYFHQKGYINLRTDQGTTISITSKGIDEAEKIISKHDENEIGWPRKHNYRSDERDKNIMKKESNSDTTEKKANPKKVFVVHGRNLKARDAMFQFLRSIDIQPIEWEEAISLTKNASPFPQQVLDKAFEIAQAIIILITGDDLAKLRDEHIKANDPDYERKYSVQARPNVIFEAGLALGKNPDRTILVELEKENTRPFSDIHGRLLVKLSNNPKSRKVLVDRLENAGCDVNYKSKSDWMETGDFDGAVIEYIPNGDRKIEPMKK
ncbi:MAG: nucleotide-binding protein [Spirochaetes bacterium]|nr:nucleotide-binding protein [Spirochaetota bacterium]